MNNHLLNTLGRITLLITFNLSLVACGVGNDDTYPTTPTTTNSTNSTNGCDDEGSGFYVDMKCFTLSTTTLDPAINNGAFTAAWEVQTKNQDPDPTTLSDVRFYVSKDKVYDSGVDIEIYYDINAEKMRTVPCTFGSDNVMKCGTFGVIPADLTAWLTTIPLDAYILGRSCSLLFSCDTESVLVKFQ